MDTSALEILVIGSKPLFERATEDLSRDGGRHNVDWFPGLDTGLDVIAEAGHHLFLIEDDGDGRGVELVERARARGIRSPLVLVLPGSDPAREVDALQRGASDVLPLEGGGPAVYPRVVRHAAARAWRIAAALTLSAPETGPVDQRVIHEATPDGLWDWDLKTDRIVYSDRWKAQLGLLDAPLAGTPDEWWGLVHPDDVTRLMRQVKAFVADRVPVFESYHRMKHAHGGYRWMLSRAFVSREDDGRARRLVGLQTDVTAGTLLIGQAAVRELHDRLTGLPSRAILVDRLTQCVARTRRNESYRFAVVALDVDRFGIVNNSLGHVIGDQLLVEIARRIRGCMRSGDTVARTGADEFALLLDDIGEPDEVDAVVGKVQDAMKLPFRVGGHEVYTSASVGVAISRTRYDKAEDLLRDASLALRRAKDHGGARSEVFSTAMHMTAVQKQLLEMSLHRAVGDDQFVLHYQPIFALDSGELAGFEALVRWQHPLHGLLGPADFIPIAEDSDLIVDLGRWVLRKACEQVNAWRRSHRPVAVSVNIAARHFNNPELIDHVATALEESDLPAELLILEITESGLMEYVGTTVPTLRWLKDLGVGVQIDDFGTGYSSLSYLTHLPVSALKVDRSFTRSMVEDQTQHQIVRAIVSLAQTLGLQVTAEGVETDEQRAQLQALRCDLAQGLLLGGPMPADEAEQLLQQR